MRSIKIATYLNGTRELRQGVDEISAIIAAPVLVHHISSIRGLARGNSQPVLHLGILETDINSAGELSEECKTVMMWMRQSCSSNFVFTSTPQCIDEVLASGVDAVIPFSNGDTTIQSDLYARIEQFFQSQDEIHNMTSQSVFIRRIWQSTLPRRRPKHRKS